ncbi:MAG TPA: TRAP transporter substrate-binding protein [Acetobacteraceae bacterium]|nr:TRAP transporter substrate-binding protein [Acetobacteraceae bacterium]
MYAMKRLSGIAVTLLVTAFPYGSMAQGQQPPDTKPQFVMKLAGAGINDNGHEWMKLYAASIEAKSGGRIKAEIYPGSQLGPIPREIEDTQLGSIQVAQFPPEFFSGVDQRFGLLAAPGLFESEQHALRAVSDPEFRKAFLAVGESKGLIGEALLLTGPAAFAMRAPFHDLASLRGKKIRVLASPFQMQQIAKLGATGVPLTLSDVLPALQQGTIDGAVGTLPTFTSLGYYGAAKYINEPGSSYIFDMAVVSKRWFDTLPVDLQAMVLTTAQEAATKTNAWNFDFVAQQRKIWAEKGGEIDVLSQADRAAMMESIGSVGADIVKAKPELQPLWDLLRTAAKRSL